MSKNGKSKLLTKLFAGVATLCMAFGVGFTVASLNKAPVNVSASDTAQESVDYKDLLGLEDRTSWASGGHADIVTLGLMDFSITEGNQYFKSSVSGCWYQGNNDVITANNNVDILQYVYINDECARDLLVANQTDQKTTANTAYWLSNPAAWPIAFETGTDVWIRIDKTRFGGEFTFTFKAGFALTREDGVRIYLSDDVNYKYANGALTKLTMSTLTFEGTTETRKFMGGEAIGALPEIPAQEGKIGVWQIDGVDINENTAYTYGADKTAKVFYLEGTEVSSTFGVANWGAAGGSDCTYIRIGSYLDAGNNLMMDTGFSDIHWQDHANEAANNFGCDIMEYIYVNGKSAREISNQNGVDRKYGGQEGQTFPFSIGGIYAPIDVVTNGVNFNLLIMNDYIEDNGLSIVFKAGFRMKTADGSMIYLAKDYGFPRCNVTFDGGEPVEVGVGEKLAEPTAPTKEATESHTYAFDGWYNGETKWDFAKDVVTGNLNLTAKFIETEKAKFTVTFNAENGTESTSATVYDGACVAKPETDPEKADAGEKSFVFLYWSLDGANAYDFTTPVTENVTLTAVYTEAIVHTVTMGEASVKVIDGEKITEPTAPTKEATAEYTYTFDGWYLGETKWDFENGVVTSDIELVAKFTETKRTYTITFNVTGNDAVTLDSVTAEYGATYDLSNLLDGVDVSRFTYEITVNGEAAESVVVEGNVTVDVTFTAKVYHIVTIGGAEQEVEDGEKITEPAAPTKEATAEYTYTFDGWYNGETKWDFENDVVTGDIELVAKFTETKRTYTVTFVVTGNDAITLDSVTVEYGEVYDLSTLLDGKDVSGYSYSITVDGVEKISVKVLADTTVNVNFTKLESQKSSGCGSAIGSTAGVLLGIAAVGVALLIGKKKED
ncbi:MAG: InlB B-repeat-containing protein [Clostridia bacterium]|nr:InlB B-repeat-containing protein [Clostridia bacterium]